MEWTECVQSPTDNKLITETSDTWPRVSHVELHGVKDTHVKVKAFQLDLITETRTLHGHRLSVDIMYVYNLV